MEELTFSSKTRHIVVLTLSLGLAAYYFFLANSRGLLRVLIAIDFAPWLEGVVFEPLKDVGYFQRFFPEGGTVTWPNRADIAPETLHERAKASEAA
jgi:Protein of unknown function (DUF2442)